MQQTKEFPDGKSLELLNSCCLGVGLWGLSGNKELLEVIGSITTTSLFLPLTIDYL